MESSSFIHIINENRIVYIYGPPGIGKSFFIKNCGLKFIDFPVHVLSSKQSTLEFLDRATSSRFKLLLDDFDSVCDQVGAKELNETNFKGVIIGNAQCIKDRNIPMFEFPKMSIHDIMNEFHISHAEALRTNGDLRSIVLGYDKDCFHSPKSIVEDMICIGGTKKPCIGDVIPEYGHVMDMIHDNYIDGSSDICSIIEALSIASIYDDKIYKGDWFLLPYLSHESCITPSILLNHTVKGPLRPGSSWTKYSNMCMKRKRFRMLEMNNIPYKIDHEWMMVFRSYILSGEYNDILNDYNICKSDIDVINNTFITKKIPVRLISSVKKHIE